MIDNNKKIYQKKIFVILNSNILKIIFNWFLFINFTN